MGWKKFGPLGPTLDPKIVETSPWVRWKYNSIDNDIRGEDKIMYLNDYRRLLLGLLLLSIVCSVAGCAGPKKTATELSPPLTARPFTDPVTNMEFAFVQGGCFQMGNTFGDGEPDEKPVHEVCVGDFYLGKYEVTQEQWQTVMGSNPSQFKGYGSNYPVEMVSWDDVQEFISRLNQKSGKRFRLPTEAEWEYAARSGGKREKWPGTSREGKLGQYAWYDENSAGRTHRVGEKRPNGLGLYDMTGNVWEWCSDWYGENYYQSSPRNNPEGPGSGSYKVLRGGSWSPYPRDVRAAFRLRNAPTYRGDSSGFRLGVSAR